MKVFLSWSGPLSQRVAEILRKYLPVMIQGLRPFLSKHDVESGSRWSYRLARELEESSFGILCLTSANLDSPWLLFEAGALTKQAEGQACGLLIGSLKPTDIRGPLSQFQHRTFSKDEFSSLVQDVNSKLEKPLEEQQLNLILDKWWPDIDGEYQSALKTVPSENQRQPRHQLDILEELLERVRIIEKNQVSPNAEKVYHLKIKGHQEQIIGFMKLLRSAEFGGYPTVFQQYGPQSAAVNIESEEPVDLMKLHEFAKAEGVELELMST